MKHRLLKHKEEIKLRLYAGGMIFHITYKKNVNKLLERIGQLSNEDIKLIYIMLITISMSQQQSTKNIAKKKKDSTCYRIRVYPTKI